VTAGVGPRRLALAVASQSKAFVRAIARAKPKAARIAVGKPYGWGGGVRLSCLKDSISKCQTKSSKFVRSEQPFFTIFRTPITTCAPLHNSQPMLVRLARGRSATSLRMQPPFRGCLPRGIGSVISEPLNVSRRQIENVQRNYVKSVGYGLDKTLKKLGSVSGGSFDNLF